MGTRAISSPTSALITNFDMDLGYPMASGSWNQIYLRGVYESTRGELFGARLYHSGSSLVAWPSSYVRNALQTFDGFQVNPIKQEPAGSRFVVPNPFLYVAKRDGRPTGFVLDVEDDGVSRVNVATIRTMDDLVQYRVSKPHLTYRNVTVVPTLKRSSELVYDFDPGAEGGTFMMVLQCTNVSVGWTVSLEYRSEEGDVQALITPVDVDNQHSFSVAAMLSVPAGSKGSLVLRYESNGIAPQPGWTIGLEALMIASYGSRSFRHGLASSMFAHLPTSFGCPQTNRLVPIGAASVAALDPNVTLPQNQL